MFYSNGAEYLARPLFCVTKVMAHGSLILVDKTRGERRGHPFGTLEESNLFLFWNKIFFFFSSKSYKLERFFPFSVTERRRVCLGFVIYVTQVHPNRELVKIQKHGRGGGSVDVTPGGGGGGGKGNMKVGSITAVPEHAAGSQKGA